MIPVGLQELRALEVGVVEGYERLDDILARG